MSKRRKIGISSERREIIKTLIISGVLFSIFLVFAIGFWAKLYPFQDILIAATNVHTILRGFLKIFMLCGFFFFALVFVATLREYFNEVAGWFEVITLMVITVGLAYGLYSAVHAFFAFVGCIIGVLYLYIIQTESV